MRTCDNALVILARGKSKGLPGKNLATIDGESLVGRAVRIARSSECFDRIIVSSDDVLILESAERAGAEQHLRTEITSSDGATSEDSLLEVLRDCRVTNQRCFLRQCTTPFISRKDLTIISEMCVKFPADTIITGYLESIHHWIAASGGGELMPIGISSKIRQPRQKDHASMFVENGGVYAFPVDEFFRKKNRFIGQVVPYVMDKWRSLDIDLAEDLEIARMQERFF